MTKISKQTKLEAILEYFSGNKSKQEFAKRYGALMLDLRTDFSLPCKLIAEEHFLYDSIFTRI
ncbi:hypothetical protein [Weissella cibaria]|uniref:hypothetical protein n=1 Tax=Weissella cibaria TaxID=137591 RepID=UPI0016815C2B|nr:hypothetical protein [Weissella cibaria]MBD1503223.1 hypothetical protein [Weissella cibaria]